MAELTTIASIIPQQKVPSDQSPIALVAQRIKEKKRLSIEDITRGLYPSSHKGNVSKARGRTTEIMKYGLAHNLLLIKEFERDFRFGKLHGPKKIAGMRIYYSDSASADDAAAYLENRQRLLKKHEVTQQQLQQMDRLAGFFGSQT